MNSTEVRRFLKTLALPPSVKLSVETDRSKNPYICARIRPDPNANWTAPLTYPGVFPVAFRQCALAAVYPTSPEMQSQTQGGNVQPHSIAMKAHEWRLAASLFSRI